MYYKIHHKPVLTVQALRFFPKCRHRRRSWPTQATGAIPCEGERVSGRGLRLVMLWSGVGCSGGLGPVKHDLCRIGFCIEAFDVCQVSWAFSRISIFSASFFGKYVPTPRV